MRSLITHLAALTPEQLSELIAARPEALLPPEPATMTELAERLSAAPLIGVALLRLSRPELQIAEALAALGDGCDRAELAGALGVASDDADLEAALVRLGEVAVAWPDGDRLRTVPLGHVWPCPLGLGAPLSALLTEQRADDLRRVARTLGVPAGTQKAVTVRNLSAWLADGANVRKISTTAPADTQELLHQLAWEGPYLDEPTYRYGRRTGPAQWAVEHGLIHVAAHWGAPLQMPCEVALALRGPDYRLPFDPAPPSAPTRPVDGESVERESASAAATALARMVNLLEQCGRTPVAPLKTGGVGVRELRRLAKTIGDSADHVRLWLELAMTTGLLAPTETGLLPTEEYDTWGDQQPAEQLTELLAGWLSSEGAPLHQPAGAGQPVPALVHMEDGAAMPLLRAAVLRLAAGLPPGAAAADVEALVSLARWRNPILLDHLDDDTGLVDGVWREAQLLGAVAHGAVSDLGRALAADQPEQLATVLGRLLAPAEETVLLQADLTAVVVGTPSRTLTVLLDVAADRETRGGASTWRFTPSSVRRALDAGSSETELLTALRDRAAGARVPQPLAYLISDTARRHGAMRVRPVACCLRSNDPVLLKEVLHARSLSTLGLTLLAPTVLASTAPIAETLTALRNAGYAPVGEHPDGTVAVERPTRQRAVPLPGASDVVTAPLPLPGPHDPGALDQLLAELFEDADESHPVSSYLIPTQPGPLSTSEPADLARRLLRDAAARRTSRR
ncbi:helicase-associated domain-containing protein [Micromonospora sp. RTP1Z1]|uniref:helicase-associated domain-containing protein n=1 Tax=Micromonospora sp. RTP1Z1 TaxID=2994043 RepID=UPI0029C94465|nr:helicase-associated domain-containing protein [Micromonospora sp. RTP1Z1]